LEYLAVSSELIKDAEAVLKGDLPRLQVQDDQFDMAGGPTWSANAGYPQLRTAERLKPPVRVIQTAPLSDGGTYTVWLQGSDGAVLTVCISCPDFFAKKRLPRHVYQGGVAAGDPGARVVPTSGPQRDGLVAALVDIVTRPLPVPDGVKDSEHEYAVAWGLLDQLSEDCKKAGDPVPERPPRQPPKKRPSQDPDPNVHPGPVITNSIGMKLALIPAGEFRMGSPTWEQYHFDSERWHSVRITRPFYIGAYEVTLGEFLQFYDDGNNKDEWTSQPKETSIWGGITLLDDKYRNYFEGQVSPLAWGHPDQTPQHPVVNVNWDDAVAFCDWLSRKEGKRYRLPTEAEWEYACRAGTKTPRYNGKDSERLVEVANVADASMREIYYLPQGLPGSDGYPFTAPVGQFEPNRFGLYDMYGNVCEWCSDWLDDAYYAKSPVDDPQGPGSGKFRVNRGGDWRNDPGIFCRSASRSGLNPMWRNCSHGFRIVREEASDDSPAPPSKE
jgi:formylglycine-generating enzyme required for sulfatase activity